MGRKSGGRQERDRSRRARRRRDIATERKNRNKTTKTAPKGQ